MSKHYYYLQAEQLHGPLTLDELKNRAVTGQLHRNTPVWSEDQDQRLAMPAMTVVEFPALSKSSAPVPNWLADVQAVEAGRPVVNGPDSPPLPETRIAPAPEAGPDWLADVKAAEVSARSTARPESTGEPSTGSYHPDPRAAVPPTNPCPPTPLWQKHVLMAKDLPHPFPDREVPLEPLPLPEAESPPSGGGRGAPLEDKTEEFEPLGAGAPSEGEEVVRFLHRLAHPRLLIGAAVAALIALVIVLVLNMQKGGGGIAIENNPSNTNTQNQAVVVAVGDTDRHPPVRIAPLESMPAMPAAPHSQSASPTAKGTSKGVNPSGLASAKEKEPERSLTEPAAPPTADSKGQTSGLAELPPKSPPAAPPRVELPPSKPTVVSPEPASQPKRNAPLLPAGRRPPQDNTQYLAKGPRDITTVDGEGNKREGRLLVLITPEKMVYREKPGAPAKEVRAGMVNSVTKVIAEGGKYVWENKVQDKQKSFEGPTIPFAERTLDLTPDSAAEFNEQLYLYYLAGQLQDRIAAAAEANDAKAIEALKVDARRFADDLKARGLNPTLAKQFADLVPLADELAALGARRAKLIAQILAAKKAELEKQRAAVLARAAWHVGYWRYYWWYPYYGNYGRYVVPGISDVSPLTGFTSIDAKLGAKLNDEMTKLLHGAMDTPTRNAFQEITESVQRARGRWERAYRQLGEQSYHIAETEALKRQRDLDQTLHEAKDYTPL